MKRYKLFKISIFAIVLSLVSCNKEFLDTAPTDAGGITTVFSSAANAYTALNGAYYIIFKRYGGNNYGGHQAIMIGIDGMGEDYVHTGSHSRIRDAYRWRAHTNATHRWNEFVFEHYYELIGNCNMILDNIESIPDNPELVEQIEGEALALRAWAYSIIIQLYGSKYVGGQTNSQLGVPLVLSAQSTEGQARATVEEVYAQITGDLDLAYDKLEGKERAFKSHIDQRTVQLLRARVALTMEDWAAAASYASEFKNDYLMSADEYTSGFNNIENKEWLWGTIRIDEQSNTFGSFFAVISPNFNASTIRNNPKAILDRLFHAMSDTDIRKANFWEDGDHGYTPPSGKVRPYTSSKFLAKSVSNSGGDVPHARVSEGILIEAEALAKLGQEDAARDVLFILANHRDPEYVLSTNSGQDLLDEIYFQRRIELWGEGFRWLDLKRLEQDLDREDSNHKSSYCVTKYEAYGTSRWNWLFPQSEVDANPNLIQNDL